MDSLTSRKGGKEEGKLINWLSLLLDTHTEKEENPIVIIRLEGGNPSPLFDGPRHPIALSPRYDYQSDGAIISS